MALVEIALFYNSMDAGLVRARLAADGIPSFLFDTEMSWQGIATPVRLMVDDDDEARARSLLDQDGHQPR